MDIGKHTPDDILKAARAVTPSDQPLRHALRELARDDERRFSGNLAGPTIGKIRVLMGAAGWRWDDDADAFVLERWTPFDEPTESVAERLWRAPWAKVADVSSWTGAAAPVAAIAQVIASARQAEANEKAAAASEVAADAAARAAVGADETARQTRRLVWGTLLVAVVTGASIVAALLQ